MQLGSRIVGRNRVVALALAGGVACAAGACSVGPDAPGPTRQLRVSAGPADESAVITLRAPRVSVSQPVLSGAFRDLPSSPAVREEDDEGEHEGGRLVGLDPHSFGAPALLGADPVLQSALPIAGLPGTIHDFLGQGQTLGSCPSATCTVTGDPPDTNGAVGKSHYVQTVNGGIAVWDKQGNILMQPKKTNLLWTGYPTTDGNTCASRNDGDPVVLYDQLADRWFITQFSLPNSTAFGGPSFQCIAVSQTGDPTGTYVLYDYSYSVSVNDYGKFSVWPDAYYASFNLFDPIGIGAEACAYDRVAMVHAQTAEEVCFTNFDFGMLPSNLDGPIPPPRGEQAFFLSLAGGTGGTSVKLYRFHADFVNTQNSSFTGPTSIPVSAYNIACSSQTRHACVPQPGTTNVLESLSDRPMFRFTYRNFGTHESLVANHSIAANGASGIRWYEFQMPGGTPTVAQSGTYAPADGSWRWMASIAQDQAEDMALGFSVSSATAIPSIAWTGRLGTDPSGAMPEGESTFDSGGGVETGTFGDGSAAQRWGDYSNMTVDPVDDCTFWYTQELYPANGIFDWDTRVVSMKFPRCAANDFTLSIAPGSQTVQDSHSTTYTVTTAASVGAAQTLALNIQDLPQGVTASFNPASVAAGSPSTLTLTAASNAPTTSSPVTFTVIGTAPAAVHAATAQISVIPCSPATTCPNGQNCSTASDGCGGTLDCGTCAGLDTCGGGGTPNKCGCTANTTCPGGQNCGTAPDGCGNTMNCGTCTPPQTCGGGGTSNVCGCIPITACPNSASCGTMSDNCGGTVPCPVTCTAPETCGGGGVSNACGCTPATKCPNGQACGQAADGCGGMISCGTCPAGQSCVANACVRGMADAGQPADAGGHPPDAGAPPHADGGATDGGRDGGIAAAAPTSENSGCGCRTAGSSGGSAAWPFAGLGALIFVRRRRRRAPADANRSREMADPGAVDRTIRRRRVT